MKNKRSFISGAECHKYNEAHLSKIRKLKFNSFLNEFCNFQNAIINSEQSVPFTSYVCPVNIYNKIIIIYRNVLLSCTSCVKKSPDSNIYSSA